MNREQNKQIKQQQKSKKNPKDRKKKIIYGKEFLSVCVRLALAFALRCAPPAHSFRSDYSAEAFLLRTHSPFQKRLCLA